MPGGCVPLLKTEKFVPTEENDKVPTVYGNKIMKAALTDSIYYGISCTKSNNLLNSTSTSTVNTNIGTNTNSASIATASSASLSKVT